MIRHIWRVNQGQTRATLVKATYSSSAFRKTHSMSKVVDAWAQPLHPGFANFKEIRRLFEQSKSFSIGLQLLEAGVGPKEHVAFMDQGNVSKVMLSAWAQQNEWLIPNEDIYEYVKAFPDRFGGLGTVNLTSPMEAVKEVEKCIKEYGFSGIRILPWLWNMPPTTNYFYPVFAKCVELDVPFCTQVGHTGPLRPSEPGRPVPYIDQVALDFPDLKIICGHIGYPWTDEMIGVAWKHANVYIDTSAHAPKYYPPQLIHFMNSYGADKVLFGTNFPQLMWDKCVKQAKELPLSEENMEKFMWKNADRLFKLGMDDSPSKSKL